MSVSRSRSAVRWTPYVRKAKAGEEKFVDTTVAAGNPAAAGTILSSSLNVIPQNDTLNGRDGRKCVVRKLDFRGRTLLASQGSLGAAHDMVRYILYKDKQCNGATATVTNILSTASFYSHYNKEEEDRFTILRDFTVNLQPPAGYLAAATANYEKPFRISCWVNDEVTFDSTATTGALATCRSNNFGLLAIGLQGNATCDYVCRTLFKE